MKRFPARSVSQVGEAFAKSLGPKLDLEVRIVGVQEISHPGSGTEFDLLFTSQTASGAAAWPQNAHVEAVSGHLRRVGGRKSG